MQLELNKKRQMERRLNTVKWVLHQPDISPAARYHVW